MRAGQQGSLSRTWAIKGTRPRKVRQQQYKSVYVFGAVCAESGKAVGIIMPYANTEAMNIHLQEISLAVTPGKHALLVMDGAGWHRSKELIVPDNITVVHLPPYSPELNPVEQVFQQLRKIKLSNACYENHEDIMEACTEAWNTFVSKKENVQSLCKRDWVNQ